MQTYRIVGHDRPAGAPADAFEFFRVFVDAVSIEEAAELARKQRYELGREKVHLSVVGEPSAILV